MRISSLIGHLAELLGTVQDSVEPADAVVARFFRSRKYLGARDRRFIADHLFGVLRDHRLLEMVLREALGVSWRENPTLKVAPLALALVRVVRSVPMIPEKELEAVHSMWNVQTPGVPWIDLPDLRCDVGGLLSREPDVVLRMSVEYSMPDHVVREWVETFGVEETKALCAGLNATAPTTARVNTLRCTPEECCQALEAEGVQVRRGMVLPEAFRFLKRQAVQVLEPFRRGCFEMQDEGSQMISHLLKPLPGELIVDVCAGAGGKALHCAALMNNNGRIVAADANLRRLRRLEERVRRSGASIIEVPPEGKVPRSLAGSADAVLVDAPCSGLGTLRRNPGTKLSLSESVSRTYAAAQSRILAESAPLVRPGGRLLYATCTLLRRENEDVVDHFCLTHPEFTVVPVQQVLTVRELPGVPGPYLVLTPHRHGTDGFFGALLTRQP